MTGFIPGRLFPNAAVVGSTAWTLIQTGQLQQNLLASLERVVFGLSLGILIGSGLALIAGLSRLGDDFVDPPMQMFRTLPWGEEALNGMISQPAWKTRPNWYLIAADDKMIPLSGQGFMSRRAGSTVVEVAGSHAIYMSQPGVVAALIEKAAKGVNGMSGRPTSGRFAR